MTATAVDPEEDLYDPDNPPEDRGFIGILTISANVSADGRVTPSYGEETDKRIATQCANYATKSGEYKYEMWFLEAEAQSLAREDGTPFRQSDIIKTRSKNGSNLGANMAPAKYATAFRDLGVSASPLKVGQSDSAVGRSFEFAAKDIKLGGGFDKHVKMYPKNINEPGFVYTGEVRVIAARKTEGEDGAPADGGTGTSLSADEAVVTLVAVLTGVSREGMAVAITTDGRLSTTPSVFGVPILESAIDESLADVLVENHAMVIDADGLLQPA